MQGPRVSELQSSHSNQTTDFRVCAFLLWGWKGYTQPSSSHSLAVRVLRYWRTGEWWGEAGLQDAGWSWEAGNREEGTEQPLQEAGPVNVGNTCGIFFSLRACLLLSYLFLLFASIIYICVLFSSYLSQVLSHSISFLFYLVLSFLRIIFFLLPSHFTLTPFVSWSPCTLNTLFNFFIFLSLTIKLCIKRTVIFFV